MARGSGSAQHAARSQVPAPPLNSPARPCPQAVTDALAAKGVHISSMGGRLLRLVTHLDVGDAHVAAAVAALQHVHTALGG